MRVPSKFRAAWRGCALAVLLCAGTLGTYGLAPKTPQPAKRLTLESLGFPGFSKSFLEAGATMFTASFVDDDHLLVTYSLRGLVDRSPEDSPDDEPRVVAALLVEINSGKVLARARWHLHDYSQYLWPLGRGRFVLRVRSSLRALAPMQNLASGNAFREMPLLHVDGKLDAVIASTEGDLLTVESSPLPKKPEKKAGAAVTFSDSAAGPVQPVEQISFLKVIGSGTVESPLQLVAAGGAHSRSPGNIPINGRGYLYASQEGRGGNWSVQFDGFDGGAPIRLAPVLSSCPPHFEFVGLGQFVTLTCRGMNERMMLSSFDFVPRETWEEPFAGPLAHVYFGASPKSGRFAFSRELSVTAPLAPSNNLALGGQPPDAPPDVTTTQEVRVYQAESGDLLLKVTGSPSLKAGQDFDISPDGASALVLRNGALEIYHLPELGKEDRKDLAEVQAHEPPAITADRVEVRRVMKHAAVAEEAPPVVAPVSSTAVAPAAGLATPTEANTIVNGDAPPAPRRAAPSLLGPGESADDAPAKKK